MRAILAIALAAVAAPITAQVADPLHGAGTPSEVPAGSYAIEPDHTQVTFAVSHMGISPFAGTFSGASGSATFDPAHPSASSVSVSIPTASVMTTSTQLTEELRSADWLDAAKFPTATFRSTRIVASGDGARIEGQLTLHGVTHPATISARFFGTAVNAMSKKRSVGFIGRLPIQRSAYGIGKYVPMVSDETVIVINAAFEKQ